MVRISRNPFRKPLSSESVPLDIQMGIINRVLFIASGSDRSEWSRIEHLPSPKGRFKNFTISSATVNTSGTYSGAWHYAPRPIRSLGDIIGIGSLQVHFFYLSFFIINLTNYLGNFADNLLTKNKIYGNIGKLLFIPIKKEQKWIFF